MADPYNLQRFEDAQAGGVYERALAEIRAGGKTSHWMWFVFPQLRGLGRSSTATFYGIASLDEAQAYLAHPVLGARLRACAEAVVGLAGQSARSAFGTPDDMKLRSSLTLFEAASGEAVFGNALDALCKGERDQESLTILLAG